MDKLKFVNDELDRIGIPYEFGEWTQAVRYPYYVGEISEEEPTTEDGKRESTLILNGFHRGKYFELERDKAKIKTHFDPICGCCGSTEGGSIAVFFASSSYIPTGEADLKRIQINLKIIEWKGDL